MGTDLRFGDVFVNHPAPPDDLDRMPDSAQVPNLQSYTMGDLRQFIRDNQERQSWITKDQLRTGSYPDNSITGVKIAERSISFNNPRHIRSGSMTTSLPSSPAAGDIALMIASAASGVIWTFWCSGSVIGGTHMRWWCIGGPPIFLAPGTSVNVPAGAGSTFLAGDLYPDGGTYGGWWEIEIGCNLHVDSNPGVSDVWVSCTTGAGVGLFGVVSDIDALYNRDVLYRKHRLNLTQGTALRMVANSNNQPRRIDMMWMTARPVYWDYPL